MPYRRVLLKLSGEALMGEQSYGSAGGYLCPGTDPEQQGPGLAPPSPRCGGGGWAARGELLRDNWLSNRVYEDIFHHCCQAWGKARLPAQAHRIHRHTLMGA